jgi:hypothetical protein
MEKDEKTVRELDGLFRTTINNQAESEKYLSEVQATLMSGIDIDDDLAHRLLQLTLQHRLDKEDVIKQLLLVNQHLCHALGINESNSAKRSLDIAAELLGADNLHRELSLLGGLWRELNKALSLTEKSKRLQLEEKKRRERILSKIKHGEDKDEVKPSSEKEKKISAKERALYYAMKDAVGHQEYFSLNLEQLSEAYHKYEGLPQFGLIYNYLAGLQGPISQFHVALQNGIGTSESIINNLSKKLGITHEKANVKQLLLRTNKALQDNLRIQKSLLRTQQNEKNYWNQLEATLEHNKKQAPKPSKRFDDAMTLRRTMNIFSR